MSKKHLSLVGALRIIKQIVSTVRASLYFSAATDVISFIYLDIPILRAQIE